MMASVKGAIQGIPKQVNEAIAKPMQNESVKLVDETQQALGGYSGQNLTPQQQEEKQRKDAEQKQKDEQKKVNIQNWLKQYSDDENRLRQQRKQQTEEKNKEKQEEEKKEKLEEEKKKQEIEQFQFDSASSPGAGKAHKGLPKQSKEGSKKRH